MNAYLETIATAIGPVTFATEEDGALVWVKFGAGIYAVNIEDELMQARYDLTADPVRTELVRDQLQAYFAGDRTTFDLPLRFHGTPWQVAVWQALTTIPFGETRTYGEIATLLGRSGAARAVGRANATNHIPIVVPCHRVIGADGTLTGFAGGLHLKTALLDHERHVRGIAEPVQAVLLSQ